MKTVWTSGRILIVATLVTMLGAGGIFIDAVNTHGFTSAHLTMMSLFAMIPLIFWGRKIQLSGHTLSRKWFFTLDEIDFKQIERVEIVQRNVGAKLEFYYPHRLGPFVSFDLDCFSSAAIKNLLHELQSQNPHLRVTIDNRF